MIKKKNRKPATVSSTRGSENFEENTLTPLNKNGARLPPITPPPEIHTGTTNSRPQSTNQSRPGSSCLTPKRLEPLNHSKTIIFYCIYILSQQDASPVGNALADLRTGDNEQTEEKHEDTEDEEEVEPPQASMGPKLVTSKSAIASLVDEAALLLLARGNAPKIRLLTPVDSPKGIFDDEEEEEEKQEDSDQNELETAQLSQIYCNSTTISFSSYIFNISR